MGGGGTIVWGQVTPCNVQPGIYYLNRNNNTKNLVPQWIRPLHITSILHYLFKQLAAVASLIISYGTMELQENKYKMMENATVTDRNIATESSV